jgi:hypothetical protein
MLTNVNSYHDGVLANYSHENIADIRKTWLYSIASSNLFETDFQALFGYYTCKYWNLDFLPALHLLFYLNFIFFSELGLLLEIWLGCWFQKERSIFLYMNFISIFFILLV